MAPHPKTHREVLVSTLTTTLNKVSNENRDRLILSACRNIDVKCREDAHLIVHTLYHRAVHDGCFHSNYAKVLKALCQAHPSVFNSIEFPTCWVPFCMLVDSLVKQEDVNFLGFVGQEQRKRVVALALVKFLGQLFLHGLWDPQLWIGELWYRSPVKDVCRKGELFHCLLTSFQPYPADSELYIECTCKLLDVLGSDGFDVPDASRCLSNKVANRLSHILSPMRPSKCSLSRRICFLLEDLLRAECASQCINNARRGTATSRRRRAQTIEAVEAERRLDPQDGKAYTLAELLEYYSHAHQYTECEIKIYFAFECVPVQNQWLQSM